MSDDIPCRYLIEVNGIPVYVSRREFERLQGYANRRARLESDWRDYTDWLVRYRLKHPHKKRAKKTAALEVA